MALYVWIEKRYVNYLITIELQYNIAEFDSLLMSFAELSDIKIDCDWLREDKQECRLILLGMI